MDPATRHEDNRAQGQIVKKMLAPLNIRQSDFTPSPRLADRWQPWEPSPNQLAPQIKEFFSYLSETGFSD